MCEVMGGLVVKRSDGDRRRGHTIGRAGLALICPGVCLLISVTMSALDGADQRDRNHVVHVPISMAVPMWNAC
jgi:hypothetical protein